MLENEFNYYKKNQQTLYDQHRGKYIVIVGEQVVGVYENIHDAYFKSKEKYQLGQYLIQECLPGVESYTQTFHSRIAI